LQAPSKAQAPARQRPSGGTTIDLTAGDAEDAVEEVGGGGNSSRKRKSGGDVIEIDDGSPAKSNRGGKVGVYEMFRGAGGGRDVVKKGGRRGLEAARKTEEDEKLRLELQEARAKLQELEKLKDKPVVGFPLPASIMNADNTKKGNVKHTIQYNTIPDLIIHTYIHTYTHPYIDLFLASAMRNKPGLT
jgi:hypothetical protein